MFSENGYSPIDNKIIGLGSYKFSVIIENQQIDNWFSEKLIDCLSVGTVPIYYGPSNINHFFDIRGILNFDTIDEFNHIIETIDDKTYEDLVPYIEKNYKESKKYVDFWDRIQKTIENKIKL